MRASEEPDSDTLDAAELETEEDGETVQRDCKMIFIIINKLKIQVTLIWLILQLRSKLLSASLPTMRHSFG